MLFGAGNALWALDAPRPGAAPREVVRFYRRAARRIVVGDSVSLVAIALFVVFASEWRERLADAGEESLGGVAFGGALLAATAGLGAETINMVGARRARDGRLTRAPAQSTFETSQVLGFDAASVGLAVFAEATAAAALRDGTLLPGWLAAATGAIGVALTTPLRRAAFLPAVGVLAALGLRLAGAPELPRAA